MVIIGLANVNNDCIICSTLSSSERVLNTLTMDILLDRHNRRRIVHKYADHFAGGLIKLRVDNIKAHALHCSWGFVPDDYVPHPELYEDGEILVERDIDGNPLNVTPLPRFFQLTAAMRAENYRERAEIELRQHKRSQRVLSGPSKDDTALPKARKRSKQR